MADIFEIAGRVHSTSQEGVVTTADEIKDETQGKKQSTINDDVAKHENDIHGNGGINDRLDIIEAAESITYGDENTGVTPNGSDFTNPDATKRAKVPTIGAILDGADDEPTAGSDNLVKSGGAYIANVHKTKCAFELGTINYTTGNTSGDSNRARCLDFYLVENVECIYLNSGFKFSIRTYDENKEYYQCSASSTWINVSTKLSDIIDSRAKYIKIVAAFADDSVIEDVADISNNVYFTLSTDKKLDEFNECIKTDVYYISKIGSIGATPPFEENDSKNRAKTGGYIELYEDLEVVLNNNEKASLRIYDANKNGIDSTSFITETFKVNKYIYNSAARYIRVVFSFSDDSNISDLSVFNKRIKTHRVGAEYSNNEDKVLRIDNTGQTLSDSEKTTVLNRIGISGIRNDLQIDSTDLVKSDCLYRAINNVVQDKIAFESGSIGVDSGDDETNTSRVRSNYIEIKHGQQLFVSSAYDITFRAYLSKDSSDFINYNYTWIHGGYINVEDYIPFNTVYYRLVIKKANSASEIDVNDVTDNVYFVVNNKQENSHIEIKNDYVLGRHIHKNTGDIYTYNYIAYTRNYIRISDVSSFLLKTGFLKTLRYYGKDYNFIEVDNTWSSSTDIEDVAGAEYIRICVKYADERALVETDKDVLSKAIYIDKIFDAKEEILSILSNTDISRKKTTSSVRSLGNVCIHCAKEHMYDDGTYPVTEWFLLEEPSNKRFYYSNDLKNKTYLFTFDGESSNYQWGILSNGDIIAVRLAQTLNQTEPQSDSKRMNPFVFKASENWAIQYEVDFGNGLKPCGWLENSGFTNLPNGNTMFGEYTRPYVETCNVWKITGDALNPNNWTVKKTFSPIGGDGDGMYKHIHCVTVDFFTGIIYCTTGDEDDYAQIWYTLDEGDTWTEIPKNESLNNGQQYRLLQMTFTPDYIFWATDTSGLNRHVMYRTARDSNGIFDRTQVELFCNLTPQEGNFSSYGQAYIPEYNCIFVYDRQDGGGTQAQSMPLRVIELDTGNIVEIGSLEAASTSTNVGFRTRYSEWYPIGGVCRVGFGFDSHTINLNKVCGNLASFSVFKDNINNLALHITRNGSNYNCRITTFYV